MSEALAPGGVHLVEVDYDPFASPELARAVPTTEAQREVWLADQLGCDASLAFNESITVALSGSVELQALQDALLALADRHESLRATFSADGSSMLIAPRGALQARLVDLGEHAAADHRAEALARLKHEAATTPFDLVEGPLVRATLARLAPGEHELVITAHHIVCDGWSFGVIARELMALYGAFAAGRQPALPPADSFGDYVLAAQEPEWARAAEADERYWVGVYDQSVPVLELPADRPRRPARTFASRREDLRLSAATVEAARLLGTKHGASLFATLFSLFAALMARLANDSDVAVGVPTAGQAGADMPNLVGHCVNLLPVRVHVDLTQPVSALLRHGSTRVLDAYEHQHCTFARLLSRLQVQRDPGRLPLVSIQFNLDSAIAADELSQPGLTAALSGNAREFENFDVFVNASQIEGSIRLECQYNVALFDAATVRRWLALYEAAIQRAAQDAQQAAAALFTATDDDLRLLAGWNATARTFGAPFAREARVEHLVTAQAARTPQAVAVIDDAGPLTYDELERRADALALALQAQRVRPGQLVGLACGRNRYLLIGLLGILKTGAGYVPLDPAFPAERLAQMRADAKLQWLVGDASVKLDAGTAEDADPSVSVLLADSIAPKDRAAAPQTDTGAPAYVIYTSGSTGKPKGVVVPHRAVVNFLASMAREPGLAAGDRLVAVTTPSFDIAVLELLLPLALGAQVILASRDAVIDGPTLRALLERHAATAMQATPSGWRLLIDAGWRGGSGFKALVGGEALPQDLARQLLERCGQVWNMYGPTETTVWSTCWAVRAGEAVSIGTPIANTVIDVLDEAMRPCPIGVPGEIWIGGDGVASGYLHRPELTAERFVADARRPGARLYCTGDRGRWLAGGRLEHLGRLDTQVKVRGFRIELGEIEAVLAQDRRVEAAVVTVREDTPGDVVLVAYVVPCGAGGDMRALREGLRRHLPEYMIPRHVVAIERIPLLPNGKIDRRALPPVRPDAPAARAAAPGTAHEAEVLTAFEEALSLKGLRPDDNFFAMGGHSLLAARLTTALSRIAGRPVRLKEVFDAPNARAMARLLDGPRAASAASEPAGGALEGAARPPPPHQADQSFAPLTAAQESIRLAEQLYPGRVTYNTPSAHRLTGVFNERAFRAALAALVRRQAVLRCAVGERDGVAGLVMQPPPDDVAMPFVDLSGIPAAERETELMRRMQEVIDQPIELTRSPLWRAALYRLEPQEHVFLFMAHHIVWDGWSFDLLYDELAALYPAALDSRVLPGVAASDALPTTFVDHAYAQRLWLQGSECARQLAAARQRFAAAPTGLPIPTDRPRERGDAGATETAWIRLERTLAEGLRESAARQAATPNMLVAAMWAALLARASGSPTVSLGMPVRGRSAAAVEPVMGLFVNVVPLVLQLDAALPFITIVQTVRHEMLAALARQDLPFDRLSSEPEFVAYSKAAGVYQAMYSFQDARSRNRQWGPLRQSSIAVMQKGAPADLGLWLLDGPGGFEGGINYNVALWDARTADMLVERLRGLLARVAADPVMTLDSLFAAAGDDASAFERWLGTVRPGAGGIAATGPLAHGLSGEEVARAAAECRLAALWSELLGIDASDIRAGDNFFDLGGSSLLFARLLARMESDLGLVVEPRRILNESLRQLAVGAAAQSAPVQRKLPDAAAPVAQAAPSRPGLLGRLFGVRRS